MITTHRDTTISNDGATILKLLDIEHPAAKILVDIAKSQDNEVGDGYYLFLMKHHHSHHSRRIVP